MVYLFLKLPRMPDRYDRVFKTVWCKIQIVVLLSGPTDPRYSKGALLLFLT